MAISTHPVYVWLARNPFRAAFLVSLILAPCLFFASFYINRHLADSRIQQEVLHVRTELGERARRADTDFEVAFGQMQGIPGLLALEPRITALLEAPQSTSLRAAANSYLREQSRGLHLDLLWLMDAHGTTLATSNFDTPQNINGQQYADRHYFREARAGKTAFQFAIGRVTGVPGFYFAAPVASHGSIQGAIALKVDLPNLTRRIAIQSGFATDDNGVVVLADDPSLLLKALPGSPATRMPSHSIIKLYQRDHLQLLSLSPYGNKRYPELVNYGPQPEPVIMEQYQHPQQGLTLHLLGHLHALPIIEEDMWRNTSLLALSMLLFCFGLLHTTGLAMQQQQQNRPATTAPHGALLHHGGNEPSGRVLSRAQFMEVLHDELAKQQTHPTPLCLVVIHIKGLRELNASRGYDAGDAVLEHTANCAAEIIRHGDSLGRLGSASFGIVLPGINAFTGRALMERMRNFWAHAPATPPTITGVSLGLGLACCPQENGAPCPGDDHLLRMAETASQQQA